MRSNSSRTRVNILQTHSLFPTYLLLSHEGFFFKVLQQIDKLLTQQRHTG